MSAEYKQFTLLGDYWSEANDKILAEHLKAITKFPEWPEDIFAALAICHEEVGETDKAAIDMMFADKASADDVIEEAAQAAAMYIRLIQSLLMWKAGKR